MSTGRRRSINQQVPSHSATPSLALNARGEEMLGSIIDDGFVLDSLDLGHHRFNVENNGRTDDVYVLNSLDLGHGHNVENNDRTDDDFVLDILHSYSVGNNGRVSGVIAASQDSIKNLEEITIDGAAESSSIMCSICLVPLSVGSKAIRMPNPCSHVYHKDCITRWLKTSNTCPLCRRSIHS